jgi:uncharacterized protein YeaO (DUF488 family)
MTLPPGSLDERRNHRANVVEFHLIIFHLNRTDHADRVRTRAAALPARPGHTSTDKELTMAIRIVRLGTPRHRGEGLRIGTVRRPPRGVPKKEFASGNWYDVWFPNLAPSLETMKLGLAAQTPAEWKAFARKYRTEMAAPDRAHAIALLAALSASTNFSVGCYCEDESHCHRSILRELLADAGAKIQTD